MLIDLPWLPAPDDAERERFATLLSAETADLGAWRRLLAYRWKESDLRRAGLRIRRSLASLDASVAGVVPFKLLELPT